MSTVRSQWVQANGLRLHCLQSQNGNRGGMPLLLLHGWPEWSHAWRPLMAALQGEFQLVAPDFRGYGASDKPAPGPTSDTTPALLAADILALADALGLARFGIETWVDNFMQPGNLQGGFNWYRSVWPTRLAVIEGRASAPAPITTPTRVFWGAHDPVLPPAWTDRLGETFTDLELSLAPDAGHFVHWEMPQAAAAVVRAFFQRLGSAA